MNIEIVAHCWNYSRILSYFLSGFILHPPTKPGLSLRVSVCYSPEDLPTVETLKFFSSLAPPPATTFNWHPMKTRCLCRRAIGRNELALATTADWFLAVDADYLWGPNAIDRFATAAAKLDAATLAAGRPLPPLIYPRTVWQSRDQVDGDRVIAAIDKPQVAWINPRDFIMSSRDRAIGGIQYIRGDFAREKGYLNGHRIYQRSVGRWRRTHEDAVFRRTVVKSTGVPISVPGLYRIRHSKRGREEVGLKL